jgi:transcriptional regulator GlxA family with amidase domain
MKHISILVLEGATPTSLDGTNQLFTRVNDLLAFMGKEAFYRVDLVGVEGGTMLNNGLFKVNPTRRITDSFKTDLIVIPIICGDFARVVEANAVYADWTRKQYGRGAEIASLCVGAFFLASTGLLNGKKCTTHWASRNDFQHMFPQVKVLENTIITDEEGMYTSGGAYSHLNLLLYIIEKHVGRDISILASKMFEIDIERNGQNQFAIFLGQKKHDDIEVLKAQEFIENSADKKITVDEICLKFRIQRRTLERRFRKSTGNSISEYIQRVKVEAVKKELEAGRKTINEIVYETGYNDINAFRNVFRKYVGMSPIQYRKKYY